MPGYDGTGPTGQGSMTGRGMGYCAVGITPEFARPLAGGMGFGLRRGRCFGPYASPAQDEPAGLKAQITLLEEQLTAVKERLSLIENGKA